MDWGNECVCGYDFDPADVYVEKTRKANKEHICCECREKILPGQEYEHVRAMWDGKWDEFKTCYLCVRIRTDVCCDGFLFEGLKEAIWEAFGFDYVTGESWDEEEEDG